ncbi:ABC transporter ATP-binding protein [Roseomonas elaeocarpi]|uniref:ABC transporter ATP-binding protein n=1 Tax=Roseomonas elaeocarpi TaxID=907779 RepID=A0ABV6K384_9PROT
MPDTTPHLLAVENLAVEFHTSAGRVRAVRGVSWHLDRGETLAILGESGSGKSVSAAAVMGLIDSPPGHVTAGHVLFEGRDLLTITEEERRGINGRRIAMVFQDTLAALNPVYSVGWQITEAFRVHGVPRAQGRARALALLERVGIPEAAHRFDDYPHQFSGGQRQRVMIAMALALRPDLLLADEPTSALDVTVQAGILALLKELQAETGMGILLITHDLGIVAEFADRVAVMNGGEVVETGTAAAILRAPQHPYTKRLLAALPGRGPLPAPRAHAEEPLLRVHELSKHYLVRRGMFGGTTGEVFRAVEGVSFELRQGETLGVVGESGSGKSTVARTLLGLETPTGGQMLYRGQDIAHATPAEMRRLRRQVQVVFQDPTASLNPRMRIGEIIAEPWEIHPGVLPPSQRPARVAELLEQVGLRPEHARRYPHQFSGGQRQRIAIARALALRPELIICDEAVSALDVSVQAQVIDLLKQLRAEYGLSFIFIAHDLPVVRDFADRVLVMHRGRIVEQGPTAQIFGNPREAYTRNLISASPSLETGRRHAPPASLASPIHAA